MHANGNISRLFIAGSSGLFTEEYVYHGTYVQQFIIMLMGQLLSDKIVTLDIMASAAVRPRADGGQPDGGYGADYRGAAHGAGGRAVRAPAPPQPLKLRRNPMQHPLKKRPKRRPRPRLLLILTGVGVALAAAALFFLLPAIKARFFPPKPPCPLKRGRSHALFTWAIPRSWTAL